MIGNVGVGKTLLTHRIMDKPIPEHSLPTVSVEFSTKDVVLASGKRMRVELWDTGKYPFLPVI
jgi:GTPase SAR1 family protein